MNMWGFTPNFLNELETGFSAFLSEIPEGEVKREYLLPTIVDELIKSGKASVKVLETLSLIHIFFTRCGNFTQGVGIVCNIR